MSEIKKRIGIVLLNLGGPTSELAVRHFLRNLFSDQDIINLGGGRLQTALAKVIAGLRYRGVVKKYREINGCQQVCRGSTYCPNRENKVIPGCCSPINSLTEQQRKALEKRLARLWPNCFVKVYTAMRYWVPFGQEIFDEALKDRIGHLVLLPLYPQFSYTTTGSTFRQWERIGNRRASEGRPPGWQEYLIGSYHLNPNYLSAVNQRIEERLHQNFTEQQRRNVHLVFTAHGIPLYKVKRGDPYTRHIEETVSAIMNMRNHRESFWLGYQSRLGPFAWTRPHTEELVFRLIDYGIKHLLLIPVAFVTDHIETLHELDIELRKKIREKKKQKVNMAITRGLNDHPGFIAALEDEIINKTKHITDYLTTGMEAAQPSVKRRN